MTQRDPKAETLAGISRLYDLVEEMNGIVAELHQTGVRVSIGAWPKSGDPVARYAVIEFSMNTEMEPLDRRC